MTLDILWKALIGVIIGLAGKIVADHFKIEKLERDLNGVGARARNAEWERYKMQLCMLSQEKSQVMRQWLTEQFLKR